MKKSIFASALELAVLAVTFHQPYLEGIGRERVGQCVFAEDVVDSHIVGWSQRAKGALSTLQTKGLMVLDGCDEEQLVLVTPLGYEVIAREGLDRSIAHLAHPVPRHLVARSPQLMQRVRMA